LPASPPAHLKGGSFAASSSSGSATSLNGGIGLIGLSPSLAKGDACVRALFAAAWPPGRAQQKLLPLQGWEGVLQGTGKMHPDINRQGKPRFVRSTAGADFVDQRCYLCRTRITVAPNGCPARL